MKMQSLSNYPSDVRQFLAAMRSERRPQRALERRSNPLVPGMNQVLDQAIYDSFSLAANTAFTKQVMFQVPQGGTKTLAQTNMTKTGILENPQRLVVQAVGVFIANNTTPTDLFNILQNVSLTFTASKRTLLEGPLFLYPAGRGGVLQAVGQSGTNASTTILAYGTSNGSVSPRDMYSLAHPIEIGSGEGFGVTLNPEIAYSTQANSTVPPGVGTTIYVILDGYVYNGVG